MSFWCSFWQLNANNPVAHLRSEPSLSKQSAAQFLQFYYWALILEFIAIDQSQPQTQINKQHRKKGHSEVRLCWNGCDSDVRVLTYGRFEVSQHRHKNHAFCLFSRMKSFLSLPAQIIIWVYDLSRFNERQVMNSNPHDGKRIPASTTELALLPWRCSWQRQQREQLMHAAVW